MADVQTLIDRNLEFAISLEGHMETCVAQSMRDGEGTKALSDLKSALAHALKHGG